MLVERLHDDPRFVRAVYGILRSRAEMVADHIAELLPPSGRILDIGAGTCNVLEVLRERRYDVTPVDVKDISIVDGLRAEIYDGRHLPYPDRSFDTAILITILHHATHPDDVVREAFRVADRVVIVEDLIEGWLHTKATYFFDALTNLEFVGHPHTNKSDAGWRALFAECSARLISAQYMRSVLWMKHGTYHLESPRRG